MPWYGSAISMPLKVFRGYLLQKRENAGKTVHELVCASHQWYSVDFASRYGSIMTVQWQVYKAMKEWKQYYETFPAQGVFLGPFCKSRIMASLLEMPACISVCS